jgi:iron only hydrogenase large subunit-like protein
LAKYYHAHRVDPDKCRGHMACMRHCPAQAIRIRNEKAIISEELCVDCGACLSICPSKAIIPITELVSEISHCKYKVVIPSSVLYSQFESSIHPYIIHQAFLKLGFDEVVDVSLTDDMLSRAYVFYMKYNRDRFPLISCNCPSIIRLIQVKYPDLVELIVPLNAPREITAREVRKNLQKKLGLNPEEIGIVYVSPCPAKIVSIKQPAEKARSNFDAAVSIKDVCSALIPQVAALREMFDQTQVPPEFHFSAGWAVLGSMTRGGQMQSWISVSGMDHVMKIMDDIENSRLRNVEFVEALSCMMGCVGGTFNVENPYVARCNSIRQGTRYESGTKVSDHEIGTKLADGYFDLESPILPRPTKYFDTDLETSIKRMREKERVYQKLRQIDCGCCGAPTCMALAEDFARGEAKLTDCIFLSHMRGEE